MPRSVSTQTTPRARRSFRRALALLARQHSELVALQACPSAPERRAATAAPRPPRRLPTQSDRHHGSRLGRSEQPFADDPTSGKGTRLPSSQSLGSTAVAMSRHLHSLRRAAAATGRPSRRPSSTTRVRTDLGTRLRPRHRPAPQRQTRTSPTRRRSSRSRPCRPATTTTGRRTDARADRVLRMPRPSGRRPRAASRRARSARATRPPAAGSPRAASSARCRPHCPRARRRLSSLRTSFSPSRSTRPSRSYRMRRRAPPSPSHSQHRPQCRTTRPPRPTRSYSRCSLRLPSTFTRSRSRPSRCRSSSRTPRGSAASGRRAPAATTLAGAKAALGCLARQ